MGQQKSALQRFKIQNAELPRLLHTCFQFANAGNGRKGGLHAGELKSYIQLCLALSQMAKTVASASPKQPQVENPKYAMRTWLLRLGFIGDEFATARDILTKNLEGDTAFRHGRAA